MEWTLSEAKTHFSEVFDRALSEGEQIVTRRKSGGRQERVVVRPLDKDAGFSRDQAWKWLDEFRVRNPIKATSKELMEWKNEGRR